MILKSPVFSPLTAVTIHVLPKDVCSFFFLIKNVCSLLRPGTAANWQSTFNNYPPLLNIISDLDDLLGVWPQSRLMPLLLVIWPLSHPRNDYAWRLQTGLSLSALTSLWLERMGGSSTVPSPLCTWPVLRLEHSDAAWVSISLSTPEEVTGKRAPVEPQSSLKEMTSPAWAGHRARCIQKAHCATVSLAISEYNV